METWLWKVIYSLLVTWQEVKNLLITNTCKLSLSQNNIASVGAEMLKTELDVQSKAKGPSFSAGI